MSKIQPHNMDYLPPLPWEKEQVSDTQYNIKVKPNAKEEGRNAPEFNNVAPDWMRGVVANVDFSHITDPAAAKVAKSVALLLASAPLFMMLLTKMINARAHHNPELIEECLDDCELYMANEFLGLSDEQRDSINHNVAVRAANRNKAMSMIKEKLREMGLGDQMEPQRVDGDNPEYPDVWPGTEPDVVKN